MPGPGPNGKALCVVRDPALRRRLKRTLRATGSTVEFLDDLADASTDYKPDLLFLDQESRRRASAPSILQVIGEEGEIVVLGESIADNELVQMMRSQPLNHIVGDGALFEESELVATSVKLLSGDIFGLDKYLSWGAKRHELVVANYDDKRDALAIIASYAEQVGARRHLITRVENVADELLMNAIYDAPAAARGVVSTPGITDNTLAARVEYACDGRYFALGVTDGYGALHREAILDNLLRARESRGQPRQDGGGGAGLGLYFVLSSVTRFIANIESGRRTEIICLFDLRQTGREAAGCASSLHIFKADPVQA